MTILFGVVVACSRPAPSAEESAPSARPASSVEAAPPAPAKAEATVRKIESRRDVPLRGPRVDARKGDWLLEGPGGVAVVSTARGAVVDFGADGGDDALVGVDPAVFLGLDEMTSIIESVGPAGPGGHAVLVKRRVLSDPPLRLWTYVTFADGALRIESVATAEEQPALAVTVGEVVAWGNVPTWVEGHGFAKEKGSLPAEFIAREGMGVAYAFAPEGGHLVARSARAEPGFHEWARTGELVESIPAWGASQRRVVTMAQAHGALGQAVVALPRYKHAPLDAWPMPHDTPERTFVEAKSCAGSPFARFDVPAAGDLRVPEGNCAVRLGAPGYGLGAWVAHDGAPPAMPRVGMLHWAVRELGAGVVPARLVVRGIGGTPDPDWGEEPADGASLDVIHADRDGQLPIPPGLYHAMVTRGFEYSMHEQDFTVGAGQTASVSATLARVVDTTGWIAADLHVHAAPSPDAPSPLPDRVRTLAASGVELAVATDHNAVTDYSAAIVERGLEPWLTSIPGDEVTTRGVPLGHYNTFPLASGAEPIAFDHATPAAVLSASRAAVPGGLPGIVQLNHPRIGSIGYFELLRFDARDVAGWKSRSALAETGFDAMEVFNGDHYADIDAVEAVMRDWYALLDAGIRITATGNSDSHKVTYHECGVPRNLVLVGDDDPRHFNDAHAPHEASFIDAIRRGHVVVSSGPFVRLDVAGHGVGETAPAGEEEVHVTVDAPPWVDVSRVELVKRGETLKAWTSPFPLGTRRLDARFTTTLAKGDWVVAIARGDREMKFLARPGAKPFGFTNPVWIE
ncbi:MAG: CehA/McbA family metallohydrolase [Polyangiaceae bacterium]